MIPFVLAAAFSAAKFNEHKFLYTQKRWQNQRSFDTACSQVNLIWWTDQMRAEQAFGKHPSDRVALSHRFRTLQQERADCTRQLIALQSELPLVCFPSAIIAKARACWALRARCQSLSRELNSAPYRGQLLVLAGPDDPSVKTADQEAPPASDPAFLARCIMRWQLRAAIFQSRSFRKCLTLLKSHQLDTLFAQLQVLHSEIIEQNWADVTKRAEKLVIMMALLQTSFICAAPLSVGSAIAASCSSYLQVPAIAKVLWVSSRFFGVASLVTAIAMGLAVHSYGNVLDESRARAGAMGKVKEVMEWCIVKAKDQNFSVLARAGLRVLQRQEERIAEMGRRIAHGGQRIANDDREIEHLRGESAEIESKLSKQKRELSEQVGKLKVQEDKLTEQTGELSDCKSKLTEQTGELNDCKSKLTEQESKLNEQKETLEELTSRLKALETLLLPQAN